MMKLREVLRLRFELHLGYQQIGRSCAIGVSTVHKDVKRAEAAGIAWHEMAGFGTVLEFSVRLGFRPHVP